MCLREISEQAERQSLSPFAVFSDASRGRMREEAPCSLRTCFQRDVDRITHAKAFRRLMHKTQVFLKPEGDHYRTRMTHTLEVARIARTMARALRLNEDLTEAAALGHDLGHTPFGHAGEAALDSVVPGGFRHNEQSLRVVEQLEKGGKGLNLTEEVRDGLLCHSGEQKAKTREGRLLHLADRIAYINHDIDDAIRAGLLSGQDIPRKIREVLGSTYGERFDTLVYDIVENSKDGDIRQSAACGEAMDALRDFMFERIYYNPVAKGEESRAKDVLCKLFAYYISHKDALPPELNVERDGVERAAADYIAGMTDRFAVLKFSQLFIPRGWDRL